MSNLSFISSRGNVMVIIMVIATLLHGQQNFRVLRQLYQPICASITVIRLYIIEMVAQHYLLLFYVCNRVSVCNESGL